MLELEWRIVEGFTDYEVSSKGEIRNSRTNKVLKGRPTNSRTPQLKVRLAGKELYVHRIVASSFYRPLLEGEVVNHIDNDPRNNAVDNLEICDVGANTRHYLELLKDFQRAKFALLPISNGRNNGLLISDSTSNGLVSRFRSEGYLIVRCTSDEQIRKTILEYLGAIEC